MKTKIFWTTALLIMALTNQAQARLVLGIDTKDGGVQSSPSVPNPKEESVWGMVKEKVNTWWAAWKADAPVSNTSTNTNRVPASAPQETEKQALLNQVVTQLPVYNVPEKGLSESRARELQVEAQNHKITQTLEPGRPAVSNLPRTQAGVPYFKMPPKVKTLPLLNIGQEARIQSSDWKLTDYKIPRAKYENPKRLPAPPLISNPEVTQFLGAAPAPAPDMQKIILAALNDNDKVTPQMVAKLVAGLGQDGPVSERGYKEISPEDMKFLRALVLYSQRDKCHFAAGLFAELSKSSRDEVSVPSDFFLGVCAHQMGLFSESMGRLLKVIESGDREYLPTAIGTLVRDVPYDYEVKVAQALIKVTEMSLVPKDLHNEFHYIVAKGMSRAGKFDVAFRHAEKVSATHKRYGNAQFIAAVAEYANGNPQAGVERNKKILTWIELNGNDKYLKTLVAHNLGRFHFQSKDYKEAIRYYQMVSKDHVLWMDALTEQGWAQLALGDSAGAIGNMYSLHSPFFKYVYKPESFVVRTIGYLNICQFGDAYRTLSRLEAEHRDLLGKIRKTQTSVTDPVAYYTAMVRFIDAKMAKDIDGFPGQVLRDMGRQRDYLNIMNSVNARLDEVGQYKFLNELRSKDEQRVRGLKRKTEERILSLQANIKKAQSSPTLAVNLNQWRQSLKNEQDLAEFHKFTLEVYAEGARDGQAYEKRAKAEVEKKRKDMIVKAGDFMKSHLKVVENNLEKILENNEFLRYEVFAGSGESLRFEMAGGTPDVTKRVPAGIRPKSADLNWSFDGEYWEDEIGHYRSSLKNNCGS